MDGRSEAARLEQIEAWLSTTRREIDEALSAAGIDPDAFRSLTVERDSLRPDLRGAYDEITDTLDETGAPKATPARVGIRI